MARKCSVCTSEDAASIDEALVRGRSQRSVSAEYRVTHDAVRRHYESHLSANLRAAARRGESVRIDGLLETMNALVREAGDVLRQARASNDDRLALSAIRETRETLKALAALMPQLKDHEAVALVRSMARVMPEHPAASRALAHELVRQGADDLAAVILPD